MAAFTTSISTTLLVAGLVPATLGVIGVEDFVPRSLAHSFPCFVFLATALLIPAATFRDLFVHVTL
jgi:hypothetical protein